MWKCPQEIQGMVSINEQLPPQATGPAEYLVSPVGSSTGSMANCYPPYLVSPVGSPEGSPKLFNLPRPFHNSSVDDPWATLPNHVSAPQALSSGKNLSRNYIISVQK